MESLLSDYNFKINKPIRLIELFGGIGSQSKALENLKVNFEHYRLVEFDKYAVASYNAIHETNFEVKDITKINGDDLGIVDTDKYIYIMTYSFPCQDLSVAGKMRGMTKGSGTRSGLLWEVERLLNECKELPQILLMENVPQVISEDNKDDFELWTNFLSSKGYFSTYKILNAVDFGVPQNRERCFMISVPKEYYYEFPNGKRTEKTISDLLESEVDEKYYLNENKIKNIVECKNKTGKIKVFGYVENGTGLHQSNIIIDDDGYLPTIDTRVECLLNIGDKSGPGQTNRVVEEEEGYLPTILAGSPTPYVSMDYRMDEGFRIRKDNNLPTICTNDNICVANVINRKIRRITPRECFRFMGFTDTDYDKCELVNSKSRLHKQAGNSIVVNVLEAIFREFL